MYAVYAQRQDFNLHPGNESCIIAQTDSKGWEGGFNSSGPSLGAE